ncbi:MAG: hypothetical protein IMW86_07935 [Hydrogenibacillus sp.]|nr:hypothetical protein [Hydrogenibacillus sp.]
MSTGVLNDPEPSFSYFARIQDAVGNRLTAVRGTKIFKGVLKKRLLALTSDALKLIREKTFILDDDFDLLIDRQDIHILILYQFAFVGKQKDAVLKAVPTKVGFKNIYNYFLNCEFEIGMKDGLITVSEKNVLPFLEVLDRRRYH